MSDVDSYTDEDLANDRRLGTDEPGDTPAIRDLRAAIRAKSAKVARLPQALEKMAEQERQEVLRSPVLSRLNDRQKEALAEFHDGDFTVEAVTVTAAVLWPDRVEAPVAPDVA